MHLIIYVVYTYKCIITMFTTVQYCCTQTVTVVLILLLLYSTHTLTVVLIFSLFYSYAMLISTLRPVVQEEKTE